jgi:hypothetical protein
MQVARRIFPVGRGLYEDYLSNFWCTSSVLIKWRSLFSGAQLMPVCAGLTVLASLPSMVQQMMQPSPRGLLLGMANSGLAFFMFSFQVGGFGKQGIGCFGPKQHGSAGDAPSYSGTPILSPAQLCFEKQRT